MPIPFKQRDLQGEFWLVKIAQEFEIAGINATAPTREEVAVELDGLLASDDAALFPRGKEPDPLMCVKGSVVLQRIYQKYNLVYDKVRSGRLIATHITAQNQPALEELPKTVASVFEESSRAANGSA